MVNCLEILEIPEMQEIRDSPQSVWERAKRKRRLFRDPNHSGKPSESGKRRRTQPFYGEAPRERERKENPTILCRFCRESRGIVSEETLLIMTPSVFSCQEMTILSLTLAALRPEHLQH